MAIAAQIKRLGKHSAIYGLGGLVQRIVAVLLLPLYTRFLSPSDYGAIEALIALSAVLITLLRATITNSFFRFYFNAEDEQRRLAVIRTSFWFTMGTATLALVAGLILAEPISHWLFDTGEHADLVRAAFVGLWAAMNYDQLTALFRVEERSVSYSIASLANVLVTIAITILLVVVLDQGPLGVLVGNFSGTLIVYSILLGYRRAQLGLEFDRSLFRRMAVFGMPFVPSVVALSIDRLQRPLLPPQVLGPARAGPVRDRRADLRCAPVPADRVPHGLAGIRLLDPRRGRGEAHVCVRHDLRRLRRLLGGAGAQPVVALARAAPDHARLLRGLPRSRASRLLLGGVRRVRGRAGVDRTRGAAPKQLDGHGRRPPWSASPPTSS